ncbi:NAD(P)-dependent dehydrogenase (short-subunit alcohol dehydrogenase family) [Rhizobium sp. BK456]|nr:NAD(P)-dependent dehydrogenase (short-subunit alcohol dehydrogenase family) [Rhizobium sp. BK456]
MVATERAIKGLLADEVGGIDMLVNKAAHTTNKPYEDYSVAEYEEALKINSSAAFVVTRICAEGMKA